MWVHVSVRGSAELQPRLLFIHSCDTRRQEAFVLRLTWEDGGRDAALKEAAGVKKRAEERGFDFLEADEEDHVPVCIKHGRRTSIFLPQAAVKASLKRERRV